MRDGRHQILHQVLEGVADDVEGDQPEQDAADVVEIDRGARDTSRLGDKSFEHLGRRLAEQFGTEHAEDGADRARQNDDSEAGAMRPQIPEQPGGRPLEVLGLLRWHTETADRPPVSENRRVGGTRCRLGTAGWRSGLRASWRAHATSSSDTCEATISR